MDPAPVPEVPAPPVPPVPVELPGCLPRCLLPLVEPVPEVSVPPVLELIAPPPVPVCPALPALPDCPALPALPDWPALPACPALPALPACPALPALPDPPPEDCKGSPSATSGRETAAKINECRVFFIPEILLRYLTVVTSLRIDGKHEGAVPLNRTPSETTDYLVVLRRDAAIRLRYDNARTSVLLHAGSSCGCSIVPASARAARN